MHPERSLLLLNFLVLVPRCGGEDRDLLEMEIANSGQPHIALSSIAARVLTAVPGDAREDAQRFKRFSTAVGVELGFIAFGATLSLLYHVRVQQGFAFSKI